MRLLLWDHVRAPKPTILFLELFETLPLTGGKTRASAFVYLGPPDHFLKVSGVIPSLVAIKVMAAY
jgi:hypothetical protein